MSDGNGIQEVQAAAQPTTQEVAARPKSVIALAPRGLHPTNMDELWRMAQMFAASELVPKDYINKPGNVAVAIELGLELGVPPMQAVQNIACINGRGSVFGDLGLAIVQSHPDFVGIEEMDHADIVEQKKAVCTIQRRGWPKVTRTFTEDMAKAAGCLDKAGPWKTAKPRMMQMRARWYAMRDTFSDALKGMGGTEEQDYDGSEARDITPRTVAMPQAVQQPAETLTAQPVDTTTAQPAEVVTQQSAQPAQAEIATTATATEPVKRGPGRPRKVDTATQPAQPAATAPATVPAPPSAAVAVAADLPSQPAASVATTTVAGVRVAPGQETQFVADPPADVAEVVAEVPAGANLREWQAVWDNDPALTVKMKLKGQLVKTAGAPILVFAKLYAAAKQVDEKFGEVNHWHELAELCLGRPVTSIFHFDEKSAEQVTAYLLAAANPVGAPK